MDYTTWPELHQSQAQTPLSSYPPSSLPSNPPPSSSYISYPQNPNFSSDPGVTPPPGVDSYAQSNLNSVIHQEAIANFAYAQGQVVDSTTLVASSGYYVDLNAQNWAALEAVRLYGTDPISYGAGIAMPTNGSEQLAVAHPNSTWWTNTTSQPHANGAWKKHQKKAKTKVVQPAYCEVCKIDCTSKEVLDQHKMGKKHKKSLEKLRESLKPPQVHPSAPSNTFVGPQLPNDKSKSVKRKSAETPENLEKKKKKVLEGGAAAEAVRICGICNVVCNSETVYNYHLAGQKHTAMMKKASEHTQSNAS